MGRPCPCRECQGGCVTHEVNFSDGTCGPLPNTGPTEPSEFSWEINADKQLQFNGTGDGEVIWTVPVEESRRRTMYRVSASVIGDMETAPAGNSGGIFIHDELARWKITFGIEDSVLRLRFFSEGGELVEVSDDNIGNLTSGKFTLTLQEGAEDCITSASGISASGVELSLELPIGFGDPLPSTIKMGVFAPPDPQEVETPGDPPFPEACPSDPNCYESFSARGYWEDGSCPETPDTTALSSSNAPLFCSGTSLDNILSGFDASSGYLIGGFPFSVPGIVDSLRLVVWAVLSSGSWHMRWAAIGSSNCVVYEDTVNQDGFSCDPFYLLIDASRYSDLIHSGCTGSPKARIEVTGSTTTCPDPDPRRYDNIEMLACGRPDPCDTSSSSSSSSSPMGEPVLPSGWMPSCPSYLGFSLPKRWTLSVPEMGIESCACKYSGSHDLIHSAFVWSSERGQCYDYIWTDGDECGATYFGNPESNAPCFHPTTGDQLVWMASPPIYIPSQVIGPYIPPTYSPCPDPAGCYDRPRGVGSLFMGSLPSMQWMMNCGVTDDGFFEAHLYATIHEVLRDVIDDYRNCYATRRGWGSWSARVDLSSSSIESSVTLSLDPLPSGEYPECISDEPFDDASEQLPSSVTISPA